MIRQLNKTATRYYPQSAGIESAKPRSCYCGHGNDFKRISTADDVTRYMCNSCKKSYVVKSPEAYRQRIEKMGNVLDNIVLGMSSRQTCLRMFIDWGHVIKHPTVIRWSNNYIQYAKMFTDDILCCLEYGKVWGIDETQINIRGWWHDADPKLLSEMKTIEGKKKNGGFLSDREFRIEWEKLRTRVEKTRRTAKKKWLTAVVDLKTRIIIHYIITDKRPNNKAIYRLVKTSAVVAGMPTDIITDCYGAYKPAIGRLEREMKRHGGSVNHILVRSKDQSTLHLKAKKSKNGAPRHNNNIESMWSKIKKNMDIMSGYGEYNSDSIISYNIINHNFIRPHSSLETFVAERHGQDNATNMTPAMAGGYPKWFATFTELLTESWGYDKSFIFKIGPTMLDRLRVGIRNKKTVVITAKEGTSKTTIKGIDRKLQVECGFTYASEKKEWTRQMPSIMNMNRRREESMGAAMPEQTFEVCNRCGTSALTTQTVVEDFGYRKYNGRIITQPNCHRCRAKLSGDPKRRTGPNRKKMAKKSALFGVQKRLE